MTTITNILSWSGTNTYLQTDSQTGMTSSDSLTENSSETAAVIAGDKISISQTSQSASNYSTSSSQDGGSDTLAKIFSAAATVITSSSSTDEDKLAAYVAVHNIYMFDRDKSYTANGISKSSPAYKLEVMYDDFYNTTKNTDFMQTADRVMNGAHTQVGTTPLETALSAYHGDMTNAAYNIGSVDISATVTETTNQTATGSTTCYSFSYGLDITSLPGVGRSTTVLDPVGVLNGTVSTTQLTTMTNPTAADDSVSSSATSATVTDTVSVLNNHRSAKQTLAEEIATDLFGATNKDKQTDTAG